MIWLVGLLAFALLGYVGRQYLHRSAFRKQREAEKSEAAKRQRRQDFEALKELKAALDRPLGVADETRPQRASD